MAVERETKLYDVQVKRRRTKEGGGYEPFWKIKTVVDALADNDTEFRCKDCHGVLKLYKTHKVGGPLPYAEHKNKEDSEYCASGLHFRKASDGREPRVSAAPVE